jgi:hypothetical protein
MDTQRITRRRWTQTAGALCGAALSGSAALGACAPGQSGGERGGGAASLARASATVQVYENAFFPWKADVGQTITAPLLAAHPWLTLETSVPAGDVREKFIAAAAADAAPDTYSANSSFVQTDFVDGLVVSLQDSLKDSETQQQQVLDRYLAKAAAVKT